MSAPQPRETVNELVRLYASSEGRSHADVWRRLYRVFWNRTGINWTEKAIKEGLSTLDFIEKRGRIGDLLELALELLSLESA